MLALALWLAWAVPGAVRAADRESAIVFPTRDGVHQEVQVDSLKAIYETVEVESFREPLKRAIDAMNEGNLTLRGVGGIRVYGDAVEWTVRVGSGRFPRLYLKQEERLSNGQTRHLEVAGRIFRGGLFLPIERVWVTRRHDEARPEGDPVEESKNILTKLKRIKAATVGPELSETLGRAIGAAQESHQAHNRSKGKVKMPTVCTPIMGFDHAVVTLDDGEYRVAASRLGCIQQTRLTHLAKASGRSEPEKTAEATEFRVGKGKNALVLGLFKRWDEPGQKCTTTRYSQWPKLAPKHLLTELQRVSRAVGSRVYRRDR